MTFITVSSNHINTRISGLVAGSGSVATFEIGQAPPKAPQRPSPPGRRALGGRLGNALLRSAGAGWRAPGFQRVGPPPKTCQYIKGDPSAEAVLCGHPVQQGSPYCVDHHQQCLLPNDPVVFERWLAQMTAGLDRH